jgi:hypothetical protein
MVNEQLPMFNETLFCKELYFLICLPLLIAIHNDINLNRFVIPGLTRNPVFSWIPAFAGMTCFVVINDAVYNWSLEIDH